MSTTLTDKGTVYTTQHYYYVFPSATTDNLKLIIKATLGGTTYYYPIVVNKSQTGTTFGETHTGDGSVAANTTYEIKAVIKNKGVTEVTEEIKPVDMNLTVTVNDWAVNPVQTTTFN